MSNYSLGRRFEYKVKKRLEKEGYLVIRSAGSHSPFDLIALNKTETLLIQCKKNGIGLKKTIKDLLKIKEKYLNGNVKILIATLQKSSKRKIAFVEV